jgi:hypothetical protein
VSITDIVDGDDATIGDVVGQRMRAVIEVTEEALDALEMSDYQNKSIEQDLRKVLKLAEKILKVSKKIKPELDEEI